MTADAALSGDSAVIADLCAKLAKAEAEIAELRRCNKNQYDALKNRDEEIEEEILQRAWTELTERADKAEAELAQWKQYHANLMSSTNSIIAEERDDLAKAEAERDALRNEFDEWKRQNAGNVRLAEDAMDAQEKTEAERDAAIATATIANVGLKAAVARADKAEAERDAMRELLREVKTSGCEYNAPKYAVMQIGYSLLAEIDAAIAREPKP